MAASRVSVIWLLLCLFAGTRAVAGQDRPTLRLLILGPDARVIKPNHATGVYDEAVPALATRPARAVTAAFVGRAIDDALIADIGERLRNYYASLGRPFIEITIPAQDVAAGTLRVNVIETRLGQIRVEGNRWFDDQQYIGAIRTRPGDPIDTGSLAADTNWINREDHRHATIAVGPGAEPSTYDVTVRAKDRLPLEFSLAADNAGTSDTGLYHIAVGVDWSNAFWRGDDLSYGFLTSPDNFRLLEHALSYTMYLPWRDSLTVAGVVADTKGHETDAINRSSTNGHTAGVSLRYSILLPAAANFIHHIDFGYDFKTTNANLLAGGGSVFPTTSELNQFVIGYGMRRGDTRGLTSVAMTLVGSPGHLTPLNTQAALAAQQPGASASYLYGRLSIDRVTNLPWSSVWSTRLTAQYSSDILLPSEQLVFGGIRSIRGFMDLGATRDNGVLIQNELRLAPITPLFWQHASDDRTLVPFVFLDLGAGRNHQDPARSGRSWLEMVSSGPGAAWQITPFAALRVSWGFPVIRNGHTGPLLGPLFSTLITF